MSAASRTQPSAAHLRLTRRGRVVIVVFTMALLLVGLTFFRVASGHADTGATQVAVVQPGDTLWSIAARVAPQHDPRVTVAKIQVLNHLSSADLQPGERLELPA
jgi:Tfp pilus assembly protein FimV